VSIIELSSERAPRLGRAHSGAFRVVGGATHVPPSRPAGRPNEGATWCAARGPRRSGPRSEARLHSLRLLAQRSGHAYPGPDDAIGLDLVREPPMLTAGEHPLDAIAAPEDLLALVSVAPHEPDDESLGPIDVGGKLRECPQTLEPVVEARKAVFVVRHA